MPAPTTPASLPENTGFIFRGEPAWPPAHLTAGQAEKMLGQENRAGRTNHDVLRTFAGWSAGRRRPRWQVDFPAHFSAQEAALYERPHAHLRRQVATPDGPWWVNPQASAPLRRALARLDRYLATPADAAEPSWLWIESTETPDDSWLIVARDDDFTAAVLHSALFLAWWRAHSPRVPPLQILASFPFPWPPATPLGSLSRAQQELRSAAIRAAQSDDPERLHDAIAATYSWPGNLADSEILQHLRSLHAQRGALPE